MSRSDDRPGIRVVFEGRNYLVELSPAGEATRVSGYRQSRRGRPHFFSLWRGQCLLKPKLREVVEAARRHAAATAP